MVEMCFEAMRGQLTKDATEMPSNSSFYANKKDALLTTEQLVNAAALYQYSSLF